jgi:uncharacterized protein YbjQ (UPF0145 family)
VTWITLLLLIRGAQGYLVSHCLLGCDGIHAARIPPTQSAQQGDVMILSTTPTLEGKAIREYRGIVVGEAILGANVFKDLFAGIRDIIGGRSGAYEKELARAREIAFDELKERAAALGANAVVGIDLDYEVVGQNGSMLMVSVSGTAVVI